MPVLTTDQYDALADAVVLLLGVGDDPAVRDQAKSAAYIVTQLAYGYTRSKGFGTGDFGGPAVAEDIQGVIITATARLVTNPQQSDSESESYPLLRQSVAGGQVLTGEDGVIATQSFGFSGGFSGWTDIEKAILHGYRKRNG